MAISFYELSVPTFLHTVRAVGGFLDRAARHRAETGSDPDDFIDARLFDDMAPFHFQIEAAWHHAVWGLEAAKRAGCGPTCLADKSAQGGSSGKSAIGSESAEADIHVNTGVVSYQRPLGVTLYLVIASKAKQSIAAASSGLDCFVGFASSQ